MSEDTPSDDYVWLSKQTDFEKGHFATKPRPVNRVGENSKYYMKETYKKKLKQYRIGLIWHKNTVRWETREKLHKIENTPLSADSSAEKYWNFIHHVNQKLDALLYFYMNNTYTRS